MIAGIMRNRRGYAQHRDPSTSAGITINVLWKAHADLSEELGWAPIIIRSIGLWWVVVRYTIPEF